MPPSAEPRLIILFTWCYRGLLRAYPFAFRQAFGQEMLQVFRLSCRQAWQSGGVSGLVWAWLRIVGDLMVTAFSERWLHGGAMSRTHLIRLGGITLLVGGLTYLLGGIVLVSIQPSIETTDLVGSNDWFISIGPTIFGVCSLAGFTGLLALQKGPGGTIAASVAWFGTAVSLVGALLFKANPLLFMTDDTDRTAIIFLAALLMAGGLIATGIVMLRTRPLVRGNSFQLWIGGWFLLFSFAGILLLPQVYYGFLHYRFLQYGFLADFQLPLPLSMLISAIPIALLYGVLGWNMWKYHAEAVGESSREELAL